MDATRNAREVLCGPNIDGFYDGLLGFLDT